MGHTGTGPYGSSNCPPWIGGNNYSDIICRGCFSLGSACGHCTKCKAEAFDWLCVNFAPLDYWAVMRTGRHDVIGAIKDAMNGKDCPVCEGLGGLAFVGSTGPGIPCGRCNGKGKI